MLHCNSATIEPVKHEKAESIASRCMVNKLLCYYMALCDAVIQTQHAEGKQ